MYQSIQAEVKEGKNQKALRLQEKHLWVYH